MRRARLASVQCTGYGPYGTLCPPRGVSYWRTACTGCSGVFAGGSRVHVLSVPHMAHVALAAK